jgi:hypothetical protein
VVEPELLDGACESMEPLGVLLLAPEPESIGGLTAPAEPPEVSELMPGPPERMSLEEPVSLGALEFVDGLALVVALVSAGVPVVAEALAPAPLAAIDWPDHQSWLARWLGEARR